jgi:hypothetical protein
MYDIVLYKNRTLKDYLVLRMVLYPPAWNGYRARVPLRWKLIKFTQENASKVPTTQGVYSFLVQPGIANHPKCSYLLYIGQTSKQNFRKRYRQYMDEQKAGDDSRRPHITEMLEKWEGYLWFGYAVIGQKRLIEEVEMDLIDAYLPPMNRDFRAKIQRALGRVFT